jgi:hypothetical protein
MQTTRKRGTLEGQGSTPADLRCRIRFNLPEVLPTFAELRQLRNPHWILIDQVSILDYCVERIEWTRDYVQACSEGRINVRRVEKAPGRLRQPAWQHARQLLDQWNDTSLNARLTALLPQLRVPQEVRDAIVMRNRLLHERFERQSQEELVRLVQAMDRFLVEVLKAPELAGERDQLSGGWRRFGPTKGRSFLGITEAVGSAVASVTTPVKQFPRRVLSSVLSVFPWTGSTRYRLPARLQAMADKYEIIAGFAQLESRLKALDGSSKSRTLVELVKDPEIISLDPGQRTKLARAVRLRNDLVHPDPDSLYPRQFVHRDLMLLNHALRQTSLRERARLAVKQMQPTRNGL